MDEQLILAGECHVVGAHQAKVHVVSRLGIVSFLVLHRVFIVMTALSSKNLLVLLPGQIDI